jgi:hypothetical protein
MKPLTKSYPRGNMYRSVKATYHPGSVFRANQNVALAA